MYNSNIIDKLGITSEPWEFDEYGICISLNDSEQGYGKVADVRGWGRLNKKHGEVKAQEIQEANGRLIAAAPEMLAALIKAEMKHEDRFGIKAIYIIEAIESATGKTWEEIKGLLP